MIPRLRKKISTTQINTALQEMSAKLSTGASPSRQTIDNTDDGKQEPEENPYAEFNAADLLDESNQLLAPYGRGDETLK